MNVKGLKGICFLICVVLSWALVEHYLTDNHIQMIISFSLVPLSIPNFLELGIVENDNKYKVYPYKLARLNSQNNDLGKRWEIVFSAWSKSENKLLRKRLVSINNIKNINDRFVYAEKVINEINNFLIAGYHFDNLKA